MGRQTIALLCLPLSIVFWGAHAGNTLSNSSGPDTRRHAAWQPVGPAPPAIEAAIAADLAADIFYIGCMGGGVLESIDRGASIRPKSTGFPIGEEPANTGFLLVNPQHPNVSDTDIINALAMSPGAPGTGYAATCHRSVYKTVTGARQLHLAADR